MAKVNCKPTIDVAITFTVDEEEAEALVDLAGYGVDSFIKAFYEKLGEGYMSRHEQGLRRFLASITEVVRPGLSHIKVARTAIKEQFDNLKGR